jgi:PAS domain-containing protein
MSRLGGEAMTAPHIDYAAVFQHLPIPILLLTPEFVIVDMNLAYLRVTERTREELQGRYVFDAFPDDPSNPSATGVDNMTSSLQRVLATRETDSLPLHKHDVEVPGSPGLFAQRYWSPVNAPVFSPDGGVMLIANCVEEVTERLRNFIGGLTPKEL